MAASVWPPASASLVNWGGVINDTITFYIDNVEYKSPRGYSFSQWVNTSYNYNGWYKNSKKSDRIDNYNTNMYISGITGSTTIENGKNYTTESIILNFTIDGTSYMSEEDMTWSQWVNSSYNTNGYKISNDKVVDSTDTKYISGITSTSSVIEKNKKYTTTYIMINFTINGESLDCRINSTWSDWVNGSGTSIPSLAWSVSEDGYIISPDNNVHINDVIASDKIIEGNAYWYSEGTELSVDFSTLSLGSTFNFGKYQVESEDPWAIEWEIVHEDSDGLIAQTKQIIDLRCFDAVESTNPDIDDDSKYLGNNNWQYSNIKQFLNSDQATWYSAQHSYDAQPNSTNVFNGNPYDTHKGFLYYFSDEEKNLLKDMTLTLANPSADGGGNYTWTGKVWLPTYTQMTGNQNKSISEGIKFDKYNSNSDRIKSINKYCAENNKYCISNSISEGTNRYYWCSSAYPSGSSTVWSVTGYGDCSTGRAYGGDGGLAPCICLPKTGGLWS